MERKKKAKYDICIYLKTEKLESWELITDQQSCSSVVFTAAFQY